MTIFNLFVFIPILIVNLVLYFVFDWNWWWLVVGSFFFIFVLRETPSQRRKRIIDDVTRESERERKEKE